MTEENKSINDKLSGYKKELETKLPDSYNGNVIDHYPWCATRIPEEFKGEIPRIRLVEKRQNYSQVFNSFLYNTGAKLSGLNAATFNIGNEDQNVEQQKQLLDNLGSQGFVSNLKAQARARDNEEVGGIYDALYIGDSTGNLYEFPFFTKEFFSLKNNWSAVEEFEILNTLPQGAGSFLKDVAERFSKSLDAPRKIFATSAFTESVKTYTPSTDGPTVTFSFTLFNNISQGDYRKNYILVQTLIKQNLHIREKKFSVIPPVYYEMDIPGLRYSPASYISSLDIKNEGSTRIIGDMLIPEAYTVTITLTDLISPTSNFFTNNFNNKVVVIKSRDALTGTLQREGI